MARVDATGGSGYVIDNGTGLNVRTKLNQISAAINSLNSGAGDPAINTAFQPHIDTSSSELKIRNALNNGYVTLGRIDQTNFGLLPLTGGTLTGTLTHNYTGAMRLPVGTTAQRPDSPAAGDFRYNSTTNNIEVYNGSSFATPGGDSFTQTGTGASSRTFQSKSEDIVSVKDFGATGDGSTNDTTAIQAAINAARGSSKVYIPKGTYRVNRTIEIPSNSHIIGEGKATVIKMMDNIGRDVTLMRTGKRQVTLNATYVQSGTTVTVTITGNHPVQGGAKEETKFDRTNYSVFAPLPQRLVTADFTSGSTTDGTYEITAVTAPTGSSTTGTFTFTVANSGETSGNVTISIGGKIEYVTIEDMTLDFNSQRHSVTTGDFNERLEDTITDAALTSGDATQDNNGATLCICFTEYALISNVRCLDAYKHCLDITSPKYKRGTNGATYDSNPSRYVTVQNCFFRGAGDDNLTTHHSSDLLITGCRSERPNGHLVPKNSNCFEVDDGSRNVTLTNNTAIKGIKGMQIKGHNYGPAPYNVVVNGFRAVNCNIGFDLRHSGFHGGSSADGTITVDEEDNTIEYTGASPTARNVSVSNLTVIAPLSIVNKSVNDNDVLARRPSYCIRCVSYENVQFTNVVLSDGYLDIADDYEDYVPTNSSSSQSTADGNHTANSIEGGMSQDMLFRIFYGASNVLIQNLSIAGFSDVEEGLRTSGSFLDKLNVEGFTSTAGPKYPIRCSGDNETYNVFISKYLIKGNQPDGAGIRVTTPNVEIAQGVVELAEGSNPGYRIPIEGGLDSTDNRQLPKPFTLSRPMTSTGGTTTDPYPVISLDQYERSQDLGVGEGLKIRWQKRDLDDSLVETCFIASRKETSTDSEDGYQLVIGTRSNGYENSDNSKTPITHNFKFTAAGHFKPSSNNSQKLGNSDALWSQVYAGNGTINTSDIRQKQDFEEINEAEKRVATVLKGKLKKYRFKDAVAKKGDDARIHFGIVAQEIKAAFEAESLDPATYGMFCYDEHFETDNEGNKTKVSDTYGVRYSELFAFILAST